MTAWYALRLCASAAGMAAIGHATQAGPGNAGARTSVVIVENMSFEPRVIAVTSGDRVAWVNRDLFPHTATADDKTFDSGAIAPAGTWTLVAGKPGVYAYTCVLHPTMKGMIKVQ
jgi:plastocyanin